MAGVPTNRNTLLAALCLTIATSAQSLLTTASKNSKGSYDYNVATVPFLSELIKLCVSSFLLYRAHKADPRGTQITTDWRNVLLFPVPSLVYLLHHSITFPLLRYVDPATYQILGNLKIVTTGLASVFVLGKRLPQIKWISLVLLTIGTTTSQLSSSSGSIFSAPVQGYLLGVANACLSAFAGVYTEYLMKKNDDSLHWQNVQLYSFGVLFNAIRLTVDDLSAGFEKGFWAITLTDGYDVVTVLVVLNLAFSGLLVSVIMKFADTIAKVFATSLAMMVTPLAAYFLFNIVPSFPLMLGICIACISVHLYYASQKDLFELSEVPKAGLPKIPSLKEVPNPASDVEKVEKV